MPLRRKGTRRGALALGALALALLGPCGATEQTLDPGGGEAAGGAVLRGRVVAVTDGDTIVVRLAGGTVERVRYIGVDTPESTPDQPLECYGHEAAEENRRLVAGREVALEPGVERRDDYGRLLAWVRAGALEVNAALLEGGYARTLAIAPNDANAPRYARIEAEAGRSGAGLWSACSR